MPEEEENWNHGVMEELLLDLSDWVVLLDLRKKCRYHMRVNKLILKKLKIQEGGVTFFGDWRPAMIQRLSELHLWLDGQLLVGGMVIGAIRWQRPA